MSIKQDYSLWTNIDDKYCDFELMNFSLAKDIFFNTYGNYDRFIESLKNGLLEVYSELAHAEWVYDLDEENFSPIKDFYKIIVDNRGLNHDSCIQKGNLLIDKVFWDIEHLGENTGWKKSHDFFVEYYFSNWKTSEFGRVWSLSTINNGDTAGKLIFYNCLISKRTVSLLTGWKDGDQNPPKIEDQKQLHTVKRASQFNWEAAFADVATWLYYDADIPDINALGVQTQIIDALRQSFENRKLVSPSDASLKSKARIIMGSLRSNKA